MSTLKERLSWIIKARGTNPSALALAAGLARSHVSGILNNDQAGNLTAATAEALARAANVRTEWLLTGRGEREPYDGATSAPAPATPTSPRPPTPAPSGSHRNGEDRYETRPAALAMMRSRGIEPEVIEAIASMKLKGDDPGISGWIDMIPVMREHIRKLDELAAAPLTPEEEAMFKTPSEWPPKPAKKKR